MVNVALLLLVPVTKSSVKIRSESKTKILSSYTGTPSRNTAEDFFTESLPTSPSFRKRGAAFRCKMNEFVKAGALDVKRISMSESKTKILSSYTGAPRCHTAEEFFTESSRTSPSFRKKGAAFRFKMNKFVKAGALDVKRISHSTIGLLSILVGLHHMVNVLVIHGFSDALSARVAFRTGVLHSLVGAFGIRRLNFKNKMESARNAMFWPAPIQGMWLTCASLTEWGQGSGAWISMWNAPFIFFTTFNIGLTFWQLSEVSRKTGNSKRTRDTIWFEDAKKNVLLVEFAYLFWMQIQMGTSLYISSCVRRGTFSAFMDTYPQMHYLLSNLALNTAFFNNLAIFIATLLRYKILAKPKHDNTIVFAVPLLSSIFIVWKVLSCFLLTEQGNMSASFLSLILRRL